MKGAKRRIAVTVWGQRVSPVFDSARTLLIAEIDGNTLINVSHLTFDPERPLELLHMLRAQRVALIICGAVSEGPATMIEAAGIDLLPFITGDVRQILEAYRQGQLVGAEFKMPGCCKNICCRGKIRRGREILPSHGKAGSARGRRINAGAPAATNEGGSVASEHAEVSAKQK